MNYYMLLFFLLGACYSHGAPAQYQTALYDQAQTWKTNYATTLKNPNALPIIIDIVLLSYQIASQSCAMIIAKLTLQEEIFKIYTPSMTDSWQTNRQIRLNDTSKMVQQISIIDQCQAKLLSLFEKFKTMGAQILQIDPQPTQTLIVQLKQGLLLLGREQADIADDIDQIQTEFLTAIETFNDIKILFKITNNITDFDNKHLKDTAESIAKSYKDIESAFYHFTLLRKDSMHTLQKFFTDFFKIYYSLLYPMMNHQQKTYNFLATNSYVLPQPHELFDNI